MKSLILALIFFGVVLYGCFDVKPFRPVRRVVRRNMTAGTGRLRATGPLVRDGRTYRVEDDQPRVSGRRR